MLIQRYELFQELTFGFTSSKFTIFQYRTPIQLYSIIAVAGLYKPTIVQIQHSLILSALTGQPSITKYQLHGKRQKRTASINVFLKKKHVWTFIDKFLHELVPYISDFKTPKVRKGLLKSNTITLRIRQKLGSFDDFTGLVEPSFHDTYKGVFLPLTVHFQLRFPSSYLYNEQYLRMLRIPVSMYKRVDRPAFDDRVLFPGY